mmetsp:Transcript_55643/g.119436  ORF Transcript_55643/g.119436 Transcript_55643/m.119436 type:complete len:599 (+) Transcript_55643:3-1799(+)
MRHDVPLIEAAIRYIEWLEREWQTGAAILVFVSGWEDIVAVQRQLEQSSLGPGLVVMPLHGQLTLYEQKQVFYPAPPGRRKVIVSTNIAETALTIDDVAYVIDCGRAKETSYDFFTKVPTLVTSWISQSAAQQRAGRAGRSQEGLCIHLYSRERHGKMDEHMRPEILRSDIADVCLHSISLLRHAGRSQAVHQFLAMSPSPPDDASVEDGLGLLQRVGAVVHCRGRHELTLLGVHISLLPVGLHLAKIMVWAAFFGVADAVVTMVAALQYREPFQAGFGQQSGLRGIKAKKQELAEGHASDLLALVGAFREWSASQNKIEACERFRLNSGAMYRWQAGRNRLHDELRSSGVLCTANWARANRNGSSVALVAAAICAGMYPNMASSQGHKGLLLHQGNIVAKPGYASVVSAGATSPGELFSFAEVTQVEETYAVSQLTQISPLMPLLLCGENPLMVEPDNTVQLGISDAADEWWKQELATGDAPAAVMRVRLDEGPEVYRVEQPVSLAICHLRKLTRAAFQAFCAAPADEHPPVVAIVEALLKKDYVAQGHSESGRLRGPASVGAQSAGAQHAVQRAAVQPAAQHQAQRRGHSRAGGKR